VAYSIERSYFPSLNERQERFMAYIDNGYWIDIGTPEKYVQVHRDMFDGRFSGGIFATADRSQPVVSSKARIEDHVRFDGPSFINAGAHVKAGARIGPYSVIGRGVMIEESADVENTIIWPNTRIGPSAVVQGPIIGRGCHIGRNSVVRGSAVLGDKTLLTDFTTI
jgi:mannose-1-phosphate guanylyltransferase